jgi:hypothetical protein
MLFTEMPLFQLDHAKHSWLTPSENGQSMTGHFTRRTESTQHHEVA